MACGCRGRPRTRTNGAPGAGRSDLSSAPQRKTWVHSVAGPPVTGESAGALKIPEQIEQQQEAAKGGFGGEELAHIEVIGGRIVLQHRDVVFHVGVLVVVTPDFFRHQRGAEPQLPLCSQPCRTKWTYASTASSE